MLITRRVTLTSPILAERPNPHKKRREFDRMPMEKDPERPNAVRIPTDFERWRWAFAEARDVLELSDVNTGCIVPVAYFDAKRTITYHRRFKADGVPRSEAFECVSSGSVLTWKFTLPETLPPHEENHPRFTRPPSEEEFDSLLAYIGEVLGMTRWGHGYGYGRFVIKKDFQSTPAA